jgi:hypothetical protein
MLACGDLGFRLERLSNILAANFAVRVSPQYGRLIAFRNSGVLTLATGISAMD